MIELDILMQRVNKLKDLSRVYETAPQATPPLTGPLIYYRWCIRYQIQKINLSL
jgi:hypothetical protein